MLSLFVKLVDMDSGRIFAMTVEYCVHEARFDLLQNLRIKQSPDYAAIPPATVHGW